MGFGIFEQMGRTPDENECPACGLTERVFKDRADALEATRAVIDQIDNDIIDLLMRRMVKARYAMYMHPEYVDDYDRELAVLARYSKRLMPWVPSPAVHELCSALFRMSRP
jgi:chorismate mutase